MYYIIYQTTNIINGKKYIGKHVTNDLNDGYLGSGIVLNRAILKYGRESFTREILFFLESEDELNAKEQEIITADIVLSEDYYNVAYGGSGGTIVLKPEHPLYDSTCKKISESLKTISNKKSEITKKNHQLKKVGMYGKKQSEKQKEAARKSATGRTKNAEEIDKQLQSYFKTITQPGYVHPLKGKPRSEEVIAAIKEKKKNEPLTKCPHCDKQMNSGNYARYHGDKCKQKPTNEL